MDPAHGSSLTEHLSVWTRSSSVYGTKTTPRVLRWHVAPADLKGRQQIFDSEVRTDGRIRPNLEELRRMLRQKKRAKELGFA